MVFAVLGCIAEIEKSMNDREIPPAFHRELWITIDEFQACEATILDRRRRDVEFNARLRVNAEPWMKLRNEEVYPTVVLCKRLSLPESTRYRLTSLCAPHDVEIDVGGAMRKFQITTAGPIWPNSTENWGRDHILMMQFLNNNGHCSGWGPYRRSVDGSITNRDVAISTQERDPAYLKGLLCALDKKTSQIL